jgi:hypothetical protein
MTDKLIAQIASDSADAAMFAAAVCSGDTWEWQRALDEVQDLEHCKRLLCAMAGLYVNYTTAVCQRTNSDPIDWLHRFALEQAEVARQMQAE